MTVLWSRFDDVPKNKNLWYTIGSIVRAKWSDIPCFCFTDPICCERLRGYFIPIVVWSGPGVATRVKIDNQYHLGRTVWKRSRT